MNRPHYKIKWSARLKNFKSALVNQTDEKETMDEVIEFLDHLSAIHLVTDFHVTFEYVDEDL